MKKRSVAPLAGYESYFIVHPPSECCLGSDELGCEGAMFGLRVYVFSDAGCRAGRCGW